jgi:hypothetical protein
MSVRLIIIIIFSFISWQVSAQDYDNFNIVDKETYRLYVEKKWDSLMIKGNQAIKSGFDYYYLRMRLGIAYYEQGNFIKASKHFKTALQFNEGDPVALEYLYYSYLFAGKDNRARFISKDFNNTLKEKTGTSSNRFFKQLNTEYLYHNCMNENIINNPGDYFPVDLQGYQVVTRSFSNFSLTTFHPLGYRFSIFHGYTYLQKNNLYHFNDGIYIVNNPDYTVRQHQYYIALNTTLQDGWMVSPSLHLLSSYYTLINSILTGSPGGLRVNYTNTNDYGLVTGLSVSKSAGLIDTRFAMHYTFLNDTEHFQDLLGFTIFPLGNLNFYIGGNIASNIELVKNPDIQPVMNVFFGFSLYEKIWLEFSGTTGKMQNFTENNGYYIYNSLDAIQQTGNMNILIPVAKKGSTVYFGSKIASHESKLYPFTELANNQISKINYNSFSIYGGISWKF